MTLQPPRYPAAAASGGPHADSKGFTLIEVLVALAIVVIGMAAVLEALSSSANTVSYMRDKTFAQWVALNQIATLRLQMQQQLPATGNTTGEIDFAGRSWHWRQEITTTQVQGLLRIDVKVRPADIKAGDDDGWFTTVSGMAGDAIASANGISPTWGSDSTQQPGQQTPGTNNTLGGTATLAPTPTQVPQTPSTQPPPATAPVNPPGTGTNPP